MQNTKKLYEMGQSIWYDNIERRLLLNGDLKEMIERGEIYGVTSNPAIFNNAIGNSKDYDDGLKPFAKEGKTAMEIYEALAVEDIQSAADQFLSLYQKTNGGDGYVSLEVNPYLAHDTDETIKDAKRLWDWVDRPNLLVKIPATKEGLPAITRSIADGINVNVTLIFSVDRYIEVMEAYIVGLEKRIAESLPVEGITSVASFFVSRLDTKVDGWLQKIDGEGQALAENLLGKIAVANSKVANEEFKKFFSSQRWQVLEAKGGQIQRLLWASTGTKNPSYSDVKYVDELIGPNTVNTVPPKTLDAFNDHGTITLSLETEVDKAKHSLASLEKLGLSLSKATQELEDEGVEAFSEAFTKLLDTVEVRRKEAL
jgi:transaldolase